ncbi:Zinc finger, CCHC domain containing [Perkinsus chesapeaki]|uniref:Zinc finger, CCHC domain containing n=1 Tax=Perkinsus chesapeaki TaxID=330153 RepID=A0A7J6LAP1_PERCH|nr:Zinc finger, CCHC domain containing [Perkinsus chesapeaki]
MEQSSRRFTEGSPAAAHKKPQQKVDMAETNMMQVGQSTDGRSPILSYMTKGNGVGRSRSTGALPRGTMEQSLDIGQHCTGTGKHSTPMALRPGNFLQGPQSIAEEMDTLLELPLTPFKIKLIHRRLNTVVSLITKFESRAREGARLEREVTTLRKRLDAETARRLQLESANDKLQEQLDDLARALSERVSNLEQYEEAAHLALRTRSSLTYELEEKRRGLLDQEDKVCQAEWWELEKELDELRKEEGIVDAETVTPKFDKRRRTSAAIRLREENQRKERLSILEHKASDDSEPSNAGVEASCTSDGASELRQGTVAASAPMPASIVPSRDPLFGATSMSRALPMTIQSGVYQFLPYRLT